MGFDSVLVFLDLLRLLLCLCKNQSDVLSRNRDCMCVRVFVLCVHDLGNCGRVYTPKMMKAKVDAPSGRVGCKVLQILTEVSDNVLLRDGRGCQNIKKRKKKKALLVSGEAQLAFFCVNFFYFFIF
jgi:putative transposon-encoded protein